jgi:hypothetical protein
MGRTHRMLQSRATVPVLYVTDQVSCPYETTGTIVVAALNDRIGARGCWLRHYATSGEAGSSIPDNVT